MEGAAALSAGLMMIGLGAFELRKIKNAGTPTTSATIIQ